MFVAGGLHFSGLDAMLPNFFWHCNVLTIVNCLARLGGSHMAWAQVFLVGHRLGQICDMVVSHPERVQ